MKTILVGFACFLMACGGAAKDPAPKPHSSPAPADGGTVTPDPTPAHDGGSAQDAGGLAQDAAPPRDDGPDILSFGTNVAQLTAGESVRFVAVVTEKGGLDRLVGGKLVDAADTIQYGAFVATTQGSYQIDLSWTQMNQAAPINFTSEEDRQFVAKFFDIDGGVSTRSITLKLQCNGIGACAGVCVDLKSDNNHCGSCDVKVADPRRCIDGQPSCGGTLSYCPASNVCVDLSIDQDNCGACGNPVMYPRICDGGMPQCQHAGESYCAATNTCVDLSTDPNNCGSCGNVVPYSFICVDGKPACKSGLTACQSDTENGCYDLTSDHENCGACGHGCAYGLVCHSSTCQSITTKVVSDDRTCTDVCSTYGLFCVGGTALYAAPQHADQDVDVGCATSPAATWGTELVYTYNETICDCVDK